MRRVEIILHRIIVGRSGYHNEICPAVSLGAVKRGPQVKILFGKIFLDILILDRRLAPVDGLDFFGDHVNGGDVVVLSEKSRYAESYVACPGYSYVILFHL